MAARRLPNKRLVRDDRLSSAARAAGFVMATPDDDSGPPTETREAPVKPAHPPLAIENSSWKSATPQRALVAVPVRPLSFHQAFLHWVASLTGRAPA